MFEKRRRGRQARNFTTNGPKILDLKSSSEQIFSGFWRWVHPGAHQMVHRIVEKRVTIELEIWSQPGAVIPDSTLLFCPYPWFHFDTPSYKP